MFPRTCDNPHIPARGRGSWTSQGGAWGGIEAVHVPALTGSTPATHRWKRPRGLKEGAHRSPGTLEAKAEDGELPGSLATDLYPASPHRCWPPLSPHTHGPSTASSGTAHPAPSQPPSWFQFVDGCICVCLHHSVRHLMPRRLCLVHCRCSDVWDW